MAPSTWQWSSAYDSDVQGFQQETPPAGGSRLLWRAMFGLADDARLIAFDLFRAREHRAWEVADLAAWLGIELHRLPILALMPRPDPQAGSFGACVSAIAQYAVCDTARLASLLRGDIAGPA